MDRQNYSARPTGRRHQRWAPEASILVIALVGVACASGGSGMTGDGGPAVDDRAAEPGASGMAMAGHDMTMTGMDMPATAGPGFTVADVRFMQGMIGHHAQAVDMAAMAPTHRAGDSLLQFAQKIDISQRDEIGFMRRWLADHAQAFPDDVQARAMFMPGMLTPEQMAQLDAARGAEFDRLFLVFMIQHHEGALVMVEDLLDSPGAAQDSDLFRFITDVDADQRDEIYVMSMMLEEG